MHTYHANHCAFTTITYTHTYVPICIHTYMHACICHTYRIVQNAGRGKHWQNRMHLNEKTLVNYRNLGNFQG